MADELDRSDGERRAERALPLGRRRFLGVLGGALFGLAAKIFVPTPAGADHLGCPAYCDCTGTVGQCHTCSGDTCTQCTNGRSCNCQGIPGVCCWAFDRWISSRCYDRYRCCDWYRSDWSVCVCRGYVGRFCISSPAQQPAA